MALLQIYVTIPAYMNENFVMNAFLRMGENPVKVKIVRNPKTGSSAGYGFVKFSCMEDAKNAFTRLNGKIMPNSNPPVYFNMQYSKDSNFKPSDENVIFVGGLSSDVDDRMLFRAFTRFSSTLEAKVVKDSLGFSKCFGFITFGNKEEVKHALATMNGYIGLGSKAIYVKPYKPQKPSQKKNTTTINSVNDSLTLENKPLPEEHEELDYWPSYSAWQYYDKSNSFDHKLPSEAFPKGIDITIPVEDDFELIDHNTKLDVDLLNREITQRDYNLWDALECSKWMPLEC